MPNLKVIHPEIAGLVPGSTRKWNFRVHSASPLGANSWRMMERGNVGLTCFNRFLLLAWKFHFRAALWRSLST
jgi:hypothetical protein